MGTTTWQIDGVHSGIHFSVRHLVVARVRGQFRRWSAALAFDDADPANGTVEVTIEAASIDTGNENRDADLRSPRFLDAEQFPALSFRSRAIERAEQGRYRIVGDLTIRD